MSEGVLQGPLEPQPKKCSKSDLKVSKKIPFGHLYVTSKTPVGARVFLRKWGLSDASQRGTKSTRKRNTPENADSGNGRLPAFSGVLRFRVLFGACQASASDDSPVVLVFLVLGFQCIEDHPHPQQICSYGIKNGILHAICLHFECHILCKTPLVFQKGEGIVTRRTVLGSSRGPCLQRDLPMQGIICLLIVC